MTDGTGDDGMASPEGVAFIGALAVVIFYWIHNAAVGVDMVTDTGVEITLFLAAFTAQYIPLRLAYGRVTA